MPNNRSGIARRDSPSEESRYDHRLHGVLLWPKDDLPGVSACWRRSSIGGILGRRFEERGLAVGRRQRSGVPRLSEAHCGVDRCSARPLVTSLNGTLWDGKTLSAWIEQRFQSLAVRQCQRLFRQRVSAAQTLAPDCSCRSGTAEDAIKKLQAFKRRPEG